MSIFKEFKEFTTKGNVVDLAVGIIIGSAFGKIVTSFVADIIMPPIGLLVGGINFTEIKFTMKDAVIDATGKVTKQAISINFGNFIQVVFDFLIIAFAIFMLIKAINRINRNKDEQQVTPPAPTKEELLLTEIRDLIKNK